VSEAKKKSNWEVWRDRLPPDTVARVESGARPAPPSAYDAFMSAVSPSARAAAAVVSDGQPPPPDETCPESARRFAAVVSENGEFAKLILFKDAEALAKYLGSIEGDDVVVVPFWGVPLRFTVGPQRYLMMPDGMAAMSIPLIPGAKILRVEADLIGTDY